MAREFAANLQIADQARQVDGNIELSFAYNQETGGVDVVATDDEGNSTVYTQYLPNGKFSRPVIDKALGVRNKAHQLCEIDYVQCVIETHV